MNSVIIIRHGESLANVDCDMYSLPDVFNILSPKGVQQCIDLSKRIKDVMDDDFYQIRTTVISSRHQRAILTAAMVMSTTPFTNHLQDCRLNEQLTTFDGTPTEPESHIRKKVLSLVEQHHGNLILFAHGNLMHIVDPTRDAPKNCEVRKYDRDALIKMLNDY